MRLTTDFWVSALLRRIFAAGDFGAVARRGAAEAGAVFLVVRDRSGVSTLLGPAPQSSYEEAKPDERRFSVLLEGGDAGEIDARLQRELRFDTDIWIVDLEVARPIAELVEISAP